MRRQFVLAAAGLAALRPALGGSADPVKVVYHVSEGSDQAAFGLGNISNHLDAEPGVQIVVVALGPGISFLLQGASDSHGTPFQPIISELKHRGVQFRACNNTLSRRHILPSELVAEAQVVPSGIAELARLQAREGYAYLKP